MRTLIQNISLGLGLIILFAVFICANMSLVSPAIAMAFVAAVIATWWIFETLPLYVTALLPIVAYPLAGIMKTKSVAPIYMSSTLLLFMGGFFVAHAMQRWNLHKRIALNIISFFGGTPLKVILGFITSCAFLSMWLSNTATCVMMVSIGLALITSYEDIEGKTPQTKIFGAALMICIAYGCTIGGMATIVGTPPNLAFTRIFEMSFPNLPGISFGQWLSFGIPLVLIAASFAACALYFIMIRGKGIKSLPSSVIENEKSNLGKISFEEKSVAIVFSLMALLWIFRKDLNLGFTTLPGWSSLFPTASLLDDGTIAILMSLTLFILPAKNKKEASTLLQPDAIKHIPWDTILLFGGGFALAKGIQISGLSALIGEQLSSLSNVSTSVLVISLTTAMTFITEITSNMASTEATLPILVSLAKEIGIHPVTLMLPTTLAASCAFMLPAATAPNAIIFGSGKVKIKQMVKVGFILNLFCIFLISSFSLFIIPNLLNH